MMKKLIAILLTAMLLCGCTQSLADGLSYADLSDYQFYFLSGVGGWYTLLEINNDGSFIGDFHDSEMGEADEEKYPNGTVYGCAYHGQLGELTQVNDYTWRAEITELALDEGQLPEYIEDGIRYVTCDEPYGLEDTDHLLIYVPGAPKAELPEGFLSWLHAGVDETADTLTFYGLYNEGAECGFTGETSLTDEELAENETATVVTDMTASGHRTATLLPPELDLTNLPANCTLSASIAADDVKADSVTLSVYTTDVYSVPQLLSLEAGDEVYVYGEFITVQTITTDAYDSILLNGGYDAGCGMTFWPYEDDPTLACAVVEDDMALSTYLGTVTLPYGEQVVYSAPVYLEDGGVSEEPMTVTVAGTEFADFLNAEWDKCPEYWGLNISVTVTDGAVTALTVSYMP